MMLNTSSPGARRRAAVAAAAMLALLAGSTSALAADTPEVEPNESKATATPATMACGDTISGTTTGTSTTAGAGATSVDYWKITTPVTTPGVYKYTLTLNSTTAGHTATLRGLSQSSGVITAGSDVSVQTALVSGTSRVSTFYGFGTGGQIYYRVDGTTSTTSPYSVQLGCSAVPVVDVVGQVVPGSVVIQPDAATTADIDWWLYDSNFNPVPGAGRDSPNTPGPSVNLAPGTYYIAYGVFPFSNDQPAATSTGETYTSGSVLDFPGVATSSQTNTSAPLNVQVISGGGSITATGTGVRPPTNEILWYRFVVATPTFPTATGAASPNPVIQGAATTLTLTVNPAAGSSLNNITSVTADVSQVSGNPAQTAVAFTRVGTTNQWTYTVPAASGTLGARTVTYSIVDPSAAGGNGSGSFTVNVSIANDFCTQAIPLGAGTVAGSNVGSTTETAAQAPTCNGFSVVNLGVWYSFTPANSNRYEITTCSASTTYDTRVFVYTGSCAAPVCLNANDSASPACASRSDAASVQFCATAGTTYYILVATSTTNTGNFALTINDLGNVCIPPANDACATAAPLTLPPGTPVAFNVNNLFATNDAIDIGTCNTTSVATAGVWWRYDATQAGRVAVNETSTQDIATGVWEMDTATAACPSAGPATICNAAESFNFVVQPGKTYYILMQSDTTAAPTVPLAGTFTFVPPAPNDNCATAAVLTLPPSTPVSFAVDNTGSTDDNIDIGTCNATSLATAGVWWRYDATGAGVVQLSETSAQNIATGVWEFDTATATCPGTGPATVCNAAESFSFNVLPGKTYYILIQNDATTAPTVPMAGTFTFIPAPTNEDCASALALQGPGSFIMSNIGSANTPSANASVVCPTTAQTMSNDVWYKWTATANGTIALMTRSIPNAFSGRLAIYDAGPAPGACPAAGAAPVSCNAFAASSITTPTPTATVTAGNVYYFQFASQTAGTTGTAFVDFDFAPAAAGSCCVGSACAMRTPGECSAAGGSYGGDGSLCSTPTGASSSYTGAGGAVPDGSVTAPGTEGVFTSTITVPDSFTVAGAEVDLVWSTGHTFIGDLIITLSNGSRTFFLTNRVRRGQTTLASGSADFISGSTYTFSDAGASTLDAFLAGTFTTIPAGVYLPGGVNGLSRGFKNTFNGVPAAGQWTLRIVDHAGIDTGTVGSWTLRLAQGSTPICGPSTTLCCRGSLCETVAVGSCTVASGSQAGASTPAGSTCNPPGNDRQPCCKADYNKAGGVELLDIFAFLNDWFGARPYADFNGQNGVDLLDIFAFLGAWFAGGC
jgi:hypothetical protein